MLAYQKKRLLKLADFLDNLPRKRFNLDVIVDAENIINREGVCIVDATKAVREGFCGTTACAIGHMPLVFPRNFKYYYDGDENIYITFKKDESLRDFECAENFFGLNNDEAYYLFTPDSYPRNKQGPKSVASRIRKFVEKGMPKKETPEYASYTVLS